MTREDALRNLEAVERMCAKQEADEVAASAAFDQASAHLAEVHTRVVVAREQLRKAQTEMMRAFSLPLSFVAEMLDELKASA